ncbi:hypothetical protein [Homoserinibacter sp. GY 40078]|uniref:hypothetical protein n=1 Tax=Homoserinibacter sp. GY 40078 TaxID=2603275 RepID=UPI0011C8D3A9|nr:hypothetical protein [Homoserinibacter sp. GY 40078]TXK17179.1 hypothetical protein FVQ89_09970 [Homoserinibacter sp. GY 40078]
MDRSTWIEHRRGDGELVGWFRPSGDGYVVVDLLGRDVSGELSWLEAEETLDALGIGYLADPYLLDREGEEPLRVRIVEVSTQRIVLKLDDFGAIGGPRYSYELPWPMPSELRPLVRGT